MKILFFLGLSTLCHTVTLSTFIGWAGYFPLSGSYVQKGFGSIEVEIIIPQQEGNEFGKPDPEEEFFKPLEIAEKLVESRPVWQEEIKNLEWEEVKIHLDLMPHEKRKLQPRVVYLPQEIGSMDGENSVMNNPVPPYPKKAILRGWQGETVVRVAINEAGRVSEVHILRSSGYSVLDNAVLKVLKKWHFEKGRERQLEIPFKFLLKTKRADPTYTHL